MTRFKKELKKKGIRFSEDFPYLPYHGEHYEYSVGIEDVDCNEEQAYITECSNVALIRRYFNRSLEVEREEWL